MKRMMALILLLHLFCACMPVQADVVCRLEAMEKPPAAGFRIERGRIIYSGVDGAFVEYCVPEELLVHDVCLAGDAVYLLATTYEALAPTGPYTLYRLDSAAGVRECGFTNCVSCFAADADGTLFFVEGESDVRCLDQSGAVHDYNQDVHGRITALCAHGDILYAATEEALWGVFRGSGRKIASLEGRKIQFLCMQDGSLVCSTDNGEYARISLQPDRQEAFSVRIPGKWQDARYAAAAEAFELLFPEYEVTCVSDIEEADVAIVAADEYDPSTAHSLTGVLNQYYAREPGTSLLFNTLLPLNSMFEIPDAVQLFSPESGEVAEVFRCQPVEVGIWMLEQLRPLPADCTPPAENCTFEELYAWAKEIREQTGVAGFADDYTLPIGIRALMSSFGDSWDDSAIFQSEEMLCLLELARQGFADGSVVPLGGEAYFTMTLVQGYAGSTGKRLLPALRTGACYPAECTVMGDLGPTDDSLRNEARRQFQLLYLAAQDQIAWDAPGAGILADVRAYQNGSDAELAPGTVQLWSDAFACAKLPNWRRYPLETLTFEKFLCQTLAEYFNSSMETAAAGRLLSSYRSLSADSASVK